MSKYVLRRLLLLVPTLIGMSLLIFIMLRLLPGDVVDLMTGGDISASAEAKQQLREALGLNDPLPVQYAKWASGIVQGDLGKSLRTREPIMAVLMRALPVLIGEDDRAGRRGGPAQVLGGEARRGQERLLAGDHATRRRVRGRCPALPVRRPGHVRLRRIAFVDSTAAGPRIAGAGSARRSCL